MKSIKEPTAIICLSPNSGGMEIDAIKLAKKLSDYTSITIVTKDQSFIASEQKSYIGINRIKLETIQFSNSFSFNIIKQTREIILNNKIRNVVFFGASELKSLYFSFLGLNINLIIRHGTTKSKPKKDLFHRLIYSQVNYHISICQHLEKNVKFIIPFGKNTKSKLIYSSFQFSNPVHIQSKTLTLLHVGRIATGKGQIDAIKACETLVQHDIEFVFNIVGGLDTQYQNEFNSFYQQCSYKNKINLIGFTNNVNQYIQQADIFIFPSYGEGLSNAFIEALSNNLICLAYNNTSFPELLDMGLFFHLVDNKNISKLKTTLLRVATNLEQEKNKTMNNSTYIQKMFSTTQEINKYLDILL